MRALLLAAAAAALACAHGQQAQSKDRTLCPESQDLVCLTAPSCTMDESRGCRVCQCSSAYGPTRPESGSPDVPRDRNQDPY
ncbi:MAG TPA: hypothetical protein VND93_23480 [Myxococcales bacterium]|jgi:hypothetical protein|nr:hypothetical protein [Myxococcales bacterium]